MKKDNPANMVPYSAKKVKSFYHTEELILKYEKIKNTLNHFDNLPTALKPLSLLSTLQCLGEL